MKRVDIKYNGADYSVGNRHVDDVQAEIDAALTADTPTWIEVNSGEGRTRTARLLITPGVAVSLVGIDDPELVDVEIS